MDKFLDLMIEAMRTQVIMGHTFVHGSYYYSDGQWYRGIHVITEWEVRSVLADYYIGNEDMIQEDKAYIQERMGSAV